MDAELTIEALGAAVEAALEADPLPQGNGQVRVVPDMRTIRYYTTLGVLDRPVAMRGRTALYGRRHLEQLVAIKRLQADGHSLAEVQLRLSALTPRALSALARVPKATSHNKEEAPKPSPHQHEVTATRSNFWRQEPSGGARAGEGVAAEDARPSRPTKGLGTATAAPAGPAERPQLRTGTVVELHPGLRLLLENVRELNDEDLQEIDEAAFSLKKVLMARGVIPRETDPT